MRAYHPASLAALLLGLSSTISAAETPVYISPNCQVWMRVQEIQPGQSNNDARVTRLDWDTDEHDVTKTINNYRETRDPTNVQLWRRLDCRSLAYYGIINNGGNQGAVNAKSMGCDDDDTLRTTAQGNLVNNDNNPVSFILPFRGAQGTRDPLSLVGPIESELSKDTVRATSGIFGIRGSLTPDRYVYAERRELLRAARELAEAKRKCSWDGEIPVGGVITQDFYEVNVWYHAENKQAPVCELLMVVKALNAAVETTLLGVNVGDGR